MSAPITAIASAPPRTAGGRATPEQVLASIVDGINTGNLDALLTLYESDAAFATQPGSLAHGLSGIRHGLAGFIAMKGTLDLTRDTRPRGRWSGPRHRGVVIRRNRTRRTAGEADGTQRRRSASSSQTAPGVS